MLKFFCSKIQEGVTVALIIFLFSACARKTGGDRRPLEEIAANEEVLAFMKTFEGRGALSDTTQPLSPPEALAAFRYPEDLSLLLVLAEPAITQPVYINFDHRGRLWVVQYNQYPYPKDVKVTSMDQHIRATFDKVPPPPGQGVEGADKITFFEDTDGDGTYDKATDAITGLNIATSVVVGRGHIWVLNPPYLLAFPDSNDDGLPDGPATVHLEGFGIEDTHAVANSLRWGPDGWLYGAQGSTCSADVSSRVSKNVRFEGQAIWRYHPQSSVFEVFAEGGGNTFDIEIDAQGRIYSGDNGIYRGQYYKQGAYYVRNFGKHGALTNPFAFGFLSNMALTGDKARFTHAFVKYEGGSFPPAYDGRMIAINPLQSFVQLSRFEANGSTFAVVDERRMLETTDHWFRPVDLTLGPDGAVYIADWYDSRLSHVDPRDTWSKNNGRIYRLVNKTRTDGSRPIDLSTAPLNQLINLLSHSNRWLRQQAVQQFGDRRDHSGIPALTRLVLEDTTQLALEALWALNLTGGFADEVALMTIEHKNPFVRLWTIRLSGDNRRVSPALSHALARAASAEQHPEVRSQLAATAKRLPPPEAVPVIRNLLRYHDDSADPDIPLQLWWGLEAQAASGGEAVLKLFADPGFWQIETVKEHLLERLMRRYAIMDNAEGYAACAQLIKHAPSVEHVKLLFNGLQEGLRGRDLIDLPRELVAALEPYRRSLNEESLAIGLRQRNRQAIEKAFSIIADPTALVGQRLSYIRIFGEINEPESVPKLLAVLENNRSSPAIRQAALLALQRYDGDEIGHRIVKAYPDKLRADPEVKLAALNLFATRVNWANQLLSAIDRKKKPGENFIAHTIRKEDVPEQIVRQLQSLKDPFVSAWAARLWPEVRSSSSTETNNRFVNVSQALKKGSGDVGRGKEIFNNSCGPCHRLFNQGGTLGPDLTGYDRTNIDELLTSILDPAAYVREGYSHYRISTVDGRVLTGTVTSRSGTSVTFTLLSGETITLPEGEIIDMEAQPSMMPDNLLDKLSDQEIRDLFTYLTSNQ